MILQKALISFSHGLLQAMAVLLVAGLSATALYTPVHADSDLGPTKLFMSNDDFPPHWLVDAPQDPVKKTIFNQNFNQDIENTGHLSLVGSPDRSDYRVRIQCAGTFVCSRLQVNIATAQGSTLVTYQIPANARTKSLPQVASFLAQTLDSRIQRIQQGETGDFGLIKPDITTISNPAKKTEPGIVPATD